MENVPNNVKDKKKEAGLEWLRRVYGMGAKHPRNPSQEDIHRAGEVAVRKIAKRLGVDLDEEDFKQQKKHI